MHRDAARPFPITGLASITGLAVLLAMGVSACPLGGALLTGEARRPALIWPANALVLGALMLKPDRNRPKAAK